MLSIFFHIWAVALYNAPFLNIGHFPKSHLSSSDMTFFYKKKIIELESWNQSLDFPGVTPNKNVKKMSIFEGKNVIFYYTCNGSITCEIRLAK